MNISQEVMQAAQRFGYTEREIKFLYLVATFSGYFLQRQFLSFLDISGRGRVTDFVVKVMANKHAKEYFYERRNMKVYHLFSRPLYAALGKENSNNRRPTRYNAADKAFTKLLSLDFVLPNLNHHYLEEEPDKVRFFTEEQKISQQFLPAQAFKGDDGSTTTHYFIDKFPMFISSPDGLVNFTYIEEESGSVTFFTRHIERYHPLLCALRSQFRLIYVADSSRNFSVAQRIFLNQFPIADPAAERARLTRYFVLRKMTEQGRFNDLAHNDITEWQSARRRYSAPAFEIEYESWKKTGQISIPFSDQKPGQFEARLILPHGGRIDVVSSSPSARLVAHPDARQGER